MSKQEDTIEYRLSEIQGTLIAPKNQYNSFGKYKYRSCEDILNALKNVLEVGECIMLTDEIVNVGTKNYVKATATFRKLDQRLSVDGWARESETKKGMDDSQITGSTSSYARKYALNGLFAIDDTKDADPTNKHGKEEKGDIVRDIVDSGKIKEEDIPDSFKGLPDKPNDWHAYNALQKAQYNRDNGTNFR